MKRVINNVSMHLPNYLTLGRLVLIPVFALVFYLPFSWSHAVSASIFALACLTDWLDGFLARCLGKVSKLGEFLDPVADKLIVSITLVILLGQVDLFFIELPAAIIIGREIVISALREWMAEIGKRTSVAVCYIGKVKTALQMIALFSLLLYRPDSHFLVGFIGYTFLYIAAILTIWSMVMYIKVAWPEFTLESIDNDNR